MTDIGKILIVAGAALAAIGLVVWGLGKAGFRGLPGDISYESPGVRVYFPIVTCIALSILLSLGMWVWRWLSGR